MKVVKNEYLYTDDWDLEQLGLLKASNTKIRSLLAALFYEVESNGICKLRDAQGEDYFLVSQNNVFRINIHNKLISASRVLIEKSGFQMAFDRVFERYTPEKKGIKTLRVRKSPVDRLVEANRGFISYKNAGEVLTHNLCWYKKRKLRYFAFHYLEWKYLSQIVNYLKKCRSKGRKSVRFSEIIERCDSSKSQFYKHRLRIIQEYEDIYRNPNYDFELKGWDVGRGAFRLAKY
jgi:hypothetical protein